MVHEPVLLQEVITFLDPRKGSFIIDGTVDGGGHATEIVRHISPGGRLLGIDWDKAMVEPACERISAAGDADLHIEEGNYANLPDILKRNNLPKADGLLLDLGFSSEQLEASGKGFSFSKDEPLHMTYDVSRTPVAEFLKTVEEKELAKIIFEHSGEKFAMRIAKAICARERVRPIERTFELRDIVRGAVPKGYERGRIDPATRTFQALRIWTNDELGNLRTIHAELPKVLKPGGRAVVISFHSLEDKIVKERFRQGEQGGALRIVTKKPVTASEEEVARNPRSRSAKLRAAQLS